jgi:hypothetical protein
MRGRYSKQPHPVSPGRKARQQARYLTLNAARVQQQTRVGDEIKIAVKEKGLYHLDAAAIANTLGIPLQRAQRKIGNLNYQLLNQGQPVAYIPAKGNTGLYFFGEDIDSIYTDKNIYWLNKKKGLSMEFVNGGSPAPTYGDETFVDTLHLEEDHYALTALFDDPKSDFWLWDFVKGGERGKRFNFYAHGAASYGTASLRVLLKGATNSGANPDHHVKVSLNGTYIGQSWWDGINDHTFEINFDQSLLMDGGNTIKVTGILDNGVPYSIFHVDSFDLTYNRKYLALNDRLLCSGDDNPVITISGFTGSDIFVFDVTKPREPKFVTGTTIDATNRVSFIPKKPNRVYLALSVNGLISPVSITADKPSSLKKKNNSADYVVIAGEGLESAAEDLAGLRERRGFETMVVELEDIYDEFSYGLSSPKAIKAFLKYAYHNWGHQGPRYVVLAGDGTYDYKDVLGYGDNLIPPLMVNTQKGIFAADNRFGDAAGKDGIPEIAIGRLPVLTGAELQTLIDKISDYENASGQAFARVMMLADNPDHGGNFPVDSNYLASLVPAGYTVEKIYLSDFTNVAQARQKVIDGFNLGALLANYIGHAGLTKLAAEGLLRTSDVPALQNGVNLPVMTAFTCIAGRFSIPGYDSLSEVLLLKENGGVAASWAPTGASVNYLARTLAEGFFNSVFRDKEKVLGRAVLKSLRGYAASGGALFIVDIYNLLGDPALEIK